MAITKVSRNLLSTGVSDSSDATAITINSSEQVGIGTTSPNTLLHAATGSNGSGLIDVARFQNVGTTVNDGARIQLTAGTSTSGAGIGCLGDALNSAHLVLHAGGNTEQMRINSNGNVRVQNGNLEIGTDGKGIDFGSSSNASGMTAELLDDYEEGTWTPSVTTGTVSTTSGSAVYTKIGNLVSAQARLNTFSDTTSTSAALVIGGLPYSPSSIQSHIGTAWGNFGDSTNRPTIFFYFNGYAYFGGANYGQVMHSSLESGTNILISLIYRHG